MNQEILDRLFEIQQQLNPRDCRAIVNQELLGNHLFQKFVAYDRNLLVFYHNLDNGNKQRFRDYYGLK
jgi:hypothetical protein